MPKPVQRRHDVDAQWEHYVQNTRGFSLRVTPGVVLMMLSAIVGAWVDPIWSSDVQTVEPRLFAIALAAASAASFGDFVYVFAKNQLALPPLTRPSSASKAAFLLRERLAAQQPSAIILSCVTQVLLSAFAYLALAQAEADKLVLMEIYCACLVVSGLAAILMVFALGVHDDEFEAAMRARAAQIGYWTALLVIGGAQIAGPLLGATILPLAPLAFVLIVVVPVSQFRGADA